MITFTTNTFTPVPTPETTIAPVASLCQPNPCGEHGRCMESSLTIPLEARRFACVCDEDYIGRLCNKRIDEGKSFILRINSILNDKIFFLVRRVELQMFDQSTPSTNIEQSTVSSMEIIRENPEIILGGFSGIVPQNAQNRFEGNRRFRNKVRIST